MIKVYPGSPRVPDLKEAVLAAARPDCDPSAPGAPRIVVLSDTISQDQLRTLYASCDLYVSTDRANGWGMPCIEAMAMGKAAATIDWSGSTEFMKEENSLLIRPSNDLEPVDPRLVQANPEVYAGQRWAKVEESEVRRVLRLAFEDRQLLREKGRRAAEDMRKHFSVERIGERFRELVESFPVSGRASGGTPGASFVWRTRARRAIGKVVKTLMPRLKS